MDQLNELTGKLTNLCKDSFAQTNDFSTRMTEEATKIAEGQASGVKEIFELGLKTQNQVMQEWMKQTTAARDMWSEAIHTFTKAFETTPTKTGKAS